MKDATEMVDEELALARAVLYRWLSHGFRYPTAEISEAMTELVPGAWAAVESLSRDGADLAGSLTRVEERRGELSVEEWESAYIGLFGHIPQGDCPPYEGEYAESEEGLQQPHELGDLAGMYEAFGLRVALGAHERFDFLPVECEFMGFLCTKQGYAEEVAEDDLLTATLDAERLFLRNHLGRWLPAFARRVVDKAGSGLHSELARLALTFVLDECRRFGIEPGTERLRLRRLGMSPEQAVTCPMDPNATDPAPIEV